MLSYFYKIATGLCIITVGLSGCSLFDEGYSEDVDDNPQLALDEFKELNSEHFYWLDSQREIAKVDNKSENSSGLIFKDEYKYNYITETESSAKLNSESLTINIDSVKGAGTSAIPKLSALDARNITINNQEPHKKTRDLNHSTWRFDTAPNWYQYEPTLPTTSINLVIKNKKNLARQNDVKPMP